MEEPTHLQDWELLSDSDANSLALEEIIHSDYFALDSSLHAKDVALVPHKNELSLKKDIEGLEKISMIFHPETEKSGSFRANGAEMEMGFEGIEPRFRNFDAVDPNDELSIGEIDDGSSFLVDDSKMEVGTVEEIMNSDVARGKLGTDEVAKGDYFQADDPKMDLCLEGTEPRHENSSAVDSEHELGTHQIQKGGSFLVNDSKIDVGFEEVENCKNPDGASELQELRGENSDEKSQELDFDSNSSRDMSNPESISVGDGEKKVLIWWKLPLDILKLCASRVRLVWSIPVAAAIIGILMVGKRLYMTKNKSRRVPLKVSFEDKKVASQLLVRAARFNEVIVRRVPIKRSPLLQAGTVIPFPVVGLL